MAQHTFKAGKFTLQFKTGQTMLYDLISENPEGEQTFAEVLQVKRTICEIFEDNKLLGQGFSWKSPTEYLNNVEAGMKHSLEMALYCSTLERHDRATIWLAYRMYVDTLRQKR